MLQPVKLCCERCRSPLFELNMRTLGQPFRADMFNPLTRGIPHPFRPTATQNDLWCPACGGHPARDYGYLNIYDGKNRTRKIKLRIRKPENRTGSKNGNNGNGNTPAGTGPIDIELTVTVNPDTGKKERPCIYCGKVCCLAGIKMHEFHCKKRSEG